MKKKVAVFTTFFDVNSGYSVVHVAETQLNMLTAHGYTPRVLVQGQYVQDEEGKECQPASFRGAEPPSPFNRQTVDLIEDMPVFQLGTGTPDDFERKVQAVENALVRTLPDYNVCLTHDIILLPIYLAHNVAMRRYAKTRPDLLWLHFIHSCPTPVGGMQYPEDARYTPPPGYIVYPNATDAGMVCSTYGLAGQEWRMVSNRASHAIDPLALLDYHPLTVELARKADLLNGEVAVIYPARLDKGKQPEKIIRLMAGIAEAGYKPRLLVVDWQSAGERFQQYINQLKSLAGSLGIGPYVNFTSRLDDRCSQGVPRRVVQELMRLSNVYIHPSRVETYSLVVHEAALAGNLVVLNHDFPVMRELFGEQALYMDFGSDRAERTYQPNEQAFWNDEAKRLIAELVRNRSLMLRNKAQREWTPDAQWKTFEPLLYMQAVG